MRKKSSGFTIVELLIVIVVVAILATISVMVYVGIQARTRDTVRQNDIRQVHKLVELYYAEHGEYPRTADNIGVLGGVGSGKVRSDANCHVGTQQEDWVPGLDVSLPQSDSNMGRTTRTSASLPANARGCYMYASDGRDYIISAWNDIESGPQDSVMYRRIGFREMSFAHDNRYYCNQTPGIGGINQATGTYEPERDWYKYSYTISNITTCDETPPFGA